MELTSSDGRNWMIRKSPSIFTSRRGIEDVRVMCENPEWGGMEADGKRYTTSIVFCAETADVIRIYTLLPNEITVPLLRQWGFIWGGQI